MKEYIIKSFEDLVEAISDLIIELDLRGIQIPKILYLNYMQESYDEDMAWEDLETLAHLLDKNAYIIN